MRVYHTMIFEPAGLEVAFMFEILGILMFAPDIYFAVTMHLNNIVTLSLNQGVAVLKYGN